MSDDYVRGFYMGMLIGMALVVFIVLMSRWLTMTDNNFGARISIEHSYIDEHDWIIIRNCDQREIIKIEKSMWDFLNAEIKVNIIKEVMGLYG